MERENVQKLHPGSFSNAKLVDCWASNNEESKSMSKLFNKWKVDIEHVTCLKALPMVNGDIASDDINTAWLQYIIPTEWDHHACRGTAIHYYLFILYHSYRLKTRSEKRILSPTHRLTLRSTRTLRMWFLLPHSCPTRCETRGTLRQFWTKGATSKKESVF